MTNHEGASLLAGTRVIDLTRVLAGPYATQILGDLGADVIKVEEVDGGDGVRSIPPFYPGGESHYFLSLNRNKQSVAINLKAPEGRQALLDLVATADVVIENFRPGVMDRLGLGFEALKAVKPDIVLCSISGYGQDSPLRDAPAFDLVVQARSGVMHVNGDSDRPPNKLGLPVGDLAGGLWSTIAILAALNRRTGSDRAQHIDISLFDGVMALEGYLTQLALLTGESPGRMGSDHHNVVPYGRFRAKDGYLVVAILVGPFWGRFCEAIGRLDLRDDERFADNPSRHANRKQLLPILDEILAEHTRAEWEEIFSAADVPHGPVLDVREALESEQVVSRQLLQTMHHPTAGPVPVVGSPIRVNGLRAGSTPAPAPLHGEHTRRIAHEVLGMPQCQIDDLLARGVFGEPEAVRESGSRSPVEPEVEEPAE